MLNRVVHFLFLGLAICTVLAGCGAVTQSKNENLSVTLEIPQDVNPARFWFGVTQKKLQITHEQDGPVVVPWQEGQSPAVDVREGDKIEFLGTDNEGQLLVTGEATVGGEKSLTIPLRQVL